MPQQPIGEVLDALFSGQAPEDIPSPFILHRFLAGDPALAIIAKDIALDVRDSAMAFRVWQLVVGRRGRAPRLGFVGPKKQAAPEELVGRIMEHLVCNRQQAEEVIELLTLRGMLERVCTEFGIEGDSKKTPATPAAPRRSGGGGRRKKAA